MLDMRGNVGIDNCENLLHIGHRVDMELLNISDTDGSTGHVGQVTHVAGRDCILHLAKMIVKTGFEERIMLDTPSGISWIA